MPIIPIVVAFQPSCRAALRIAARISPGAKELTMVSYAKDPRCIAMADVLVPLLRRTCPENGGGCGGSYQVNLDDEVAGNPLGQDDGVVRCPLVCCAERVVVLGSGRALPREHARLHAGGEG
ncbi:hypothetical protein ACFRFL_22050 [Streptomyces sp. NPDC056708]|uniref:hypothetical protein n=1 Tax=unclassified Streptomyces TaxID=2593676 RepID=UPI0036A78E53